MLTIIFNENYQRYRVWIASYSKCVVLLHNMLFAWEDYYTHLFSVLLVPHRNKPTCSIF